MQTLLVMTIIGKDRTGLVESLARLVAEHEGNWLESRMCRLGGEFAGILRVQIPTNRRGTLELALGKLAELKIVFQPGEASAPAGPPSFTTLEVVGPDRPGIIREVTRALAAQGVNVEELATECISAPMSGELLFQARAKLLLPANITVSELKQSLDRAAGEMGLEFSLSVM